MTKKRLILTVSIALVFLILILGSTEGKSLVGKAFADFSSEQKQVYWKCIKSDCQELLKAKQYPVYRVCALNCSDYAGKFTSEQNWCEDSDGLNYTQKGVVKSNLYPSGKEDYCYTFPNNKTYLMEGKCKDNKYSYMQKNCGEMGEWECDIKKGACDIIEPPVINAYLIYWGNHYSIAEIEQKTESLQKYFNERTNGKVSIKIKHGEHFDLPPEDAVHDYSTLALKYNLNLDSAKKIWFYYNPEIINTEIEDLIKKSEYNSQNDKIIIILTDIFYSNFGKTFKYYPFIIIRDAIYQDYETTKLKIEYFSDTLIGDVLAHELGHYMGLTHACALIPCSDCAYPNDIMSYCRTKGAVENKFFSCSVSNIQEYAQEYPDGSMYPINKYFQLCDDLSSASLCYGVNCGNYCENDKSYYLGGECNFNSGVCEYNIQLGNPICTGGCTKILSRTNIANGVYSGIGIDDNTGWVAVNLNENDNLLTGFGWNGWKEKKKLLSLKLIGFTWDGLPIKENQVNPDEIIIDIPGKAKVYSYKSSSYNAENAVLDKNNVQNYNQLEYKGGCEELEDPCLNDNCEEDCNSLNGECIIFDECTDYCDVNTNSWYYLGTYNLQTGECEYKQKNNVCGKYEVVSRTNVENGLYNTAGITKDQQKPWVAVKEGGVLITLNYLQDTFKLPWRTYTLVGYTWDNKSIEKEYYFGDYNKYLIDGKYLFENVPLSYAIISPTINSDYIELEYHASTNGLINLCGNVTCDNYCTGNTLKYAGFCNYGTGKCEYKLKESDICNSECNQVYSRTNKNNGDYSTFGGTNDNEFPWLAVINNSSNLLLALGWVPGQAINSSDRTDYDLIEYTWDKKTIISNPNNPLVYIVDYKGKFTTTSMIKENAVVNVNPIPEYIGLEFYGLNCN